MTQHPCELCEAPCRTAKNPYGWVCKQCYGQLDRWYSFQFEPRGSKASRKLGSEAHSIAFLRDKAEGKLPSTADDSPFRYRKWGPSPTKY